MELEVQHENQTIILWLRSGCRTDLSMLYELGKTWRYRVVVIRSGFGSLIKQYVHASLVQPRNADWKGFPWVRIGSILALKKGRRLQ